MADKEEVKLWMEDKRAAETAEGEEKSPKKPKTFHRQLALLDVVKEAQDRCSHDLIQISPTLIACAECGALWLK